jgi:SAM-dependent methyltransferase
MITTMKQQSRRLAGILLIPILRRILAQPRMREWALLHLSNELSMRDAAFSKALPPDMAHIHGFEDCYFLFSNNKLNHGLSRLRFDEAAFLFRLVRSLGHPRVVELGRYKGGTTLILAAAGGHVLSVDNGALPNVPQFTRELEQALDQLHLRDRVAPLMADAATHPVEAEMADIIFLDCAQDYEGTRLIFGHWWPALKPGGRLVLCDGVNSPLEGVVAFATEVPALFADARRTPDACGSFAIFQKVGG